MKKLTRDNVEIAGKRTLKILQFGGGNFMRAYLDWMVERMNHKTQFAGGIVLIKPTPGSRYADLEKQGGLYHVKTRGFSKGKIINDLELIGCVDKFGYPYLDFRAFLELAAVESLNLIVSNTTESGIVFSPSDQASDQPPSSFPGKLCVFLKARFDFWQGDMRKGFTILPFELIEHNGDVLKKIVLELAQSWYDQPDFIDWIEKANVFANTLVDRIVPGAPNPEETKSIQQQIGFSDQAIVVAEPYHLLVVQGAPALEKIFPLQAAGINAVLTTDLSLYRLLKVRLLNGAHIALVPIGLLLGINTVRDCVNHPHISGFLERLLRKEISRSLPSVDGDQITSYIEEVLDRFRNPFVEHKLSSIALNAISKFKVRILPSLKTCIQENKEYPECMILAFASLLRFYRGEWEGHRLPLNDAQDIQNVLDAAWQKYGDDYVGFCGEMLADVHLWEEDLTLVEGLVSRVAAGIQIIADGQLGKQVMLLAQREA